MRAMVFNLLISLSLPPFGGSYFFFFLGGSYFDFLLTLALGLHMILSQIHHDTQTTNEGIKFVVCL